MDRTELLARGSIPRLLLTFSIPAIIGMVAQGLYNAIDRVFVGHAVGPNGIAATTVAFPLMLVLMAFGMLIGFGATALISIRLGEGNRRAAEEVLGNATVLLVGVALVLTALGEAMLDPLLRLFGASEAVLPFAHDYAQVIVWGAVCQMVFFGLNATIRGEGNPGVAMLSMLISVLLNLGLAPLFIFKLGWGMKGAALATVLAQAIAAVWVVAHFFTRRSVLRLRPALFRLRWPICAAIVAVGSPHFAMQLAASVMNSLLNHQLGVWGGDLAISVMGIIYTVAVMIAMPIFGINQGAQPIIGYNYGAERFDRVKHALQTAVLAASVLAVLGFVVAMLFPARVVRLFNDEDQALAAMGSHAMRVSLAMLPLIGFQIVSSSYFQAVGKPRQAVLLALSRQVLLLIPAVLVLPGFFGLEGVWAALPAADFGSSVLTGVFLFRELRHLHARHAETLAAGDSYSAWAETPGSFTGE